MEDSGPVTVTQVIDDQLKGLRTKTKNPLTNQQAEDAYGDLVSTISVLNSAWAAETGIPTLEVSGSSGPTVEDVKHGGTDRRAVRAWRLIEVRAVAGESTSRDKQMGLVESPRIVTKLKDWIIQIKDILRDIAKAMKATSYTVTVGFPWGVSIAVTFNI